MKDPSEKWIEERVHAVLAQLAGAPENVLDDAVHDSCAEVAAETNNAGKPAQVEFLLRHGWKPADIISRAQRPQPQSNDDDRTDNSGD